MPGGQEVKDTLPPDNSKPERPVLIPERTQRIFYRATPTMAVFGTASSPELGVTG